MILMNYISVKEASEKWKISDSRIRVLCREGRIEGAMKIGRNWLIPPMLKWDWNVNVIFSDHGVVRMFTVLDRRNINNT